MISFLFTTPKNTFEVFNQQTNRSLFLLLLDNALLLCFGCIIWTENWNYNISKTKILLFTVLKSKEWLINISRQFKTYLHKCCCRLVYILFRNHSSIRREYRRNAECIRRCSWRIRFLRIGLSVHPRSSDSLYVCRTLSTMVCTCHRRSRIPYACRKLVWTGLGIYMYIL